MVGDGKYFKMMIGLDHLGFLFLISLIYSLINYTRQQGT